MASPPVEVYSDHGTCFKGVSNDIENQRKTFEALASVTSSKAKWLFIHPVTPHMGG